MENLIPYIRIKLITTNAMKNLFILLFVPITLFGQAKKEVVHNQSYDRLNIKFNNYIDKKRKASVFQLVGVGMLSYGFLSNYYLSRKNGFIDPKKEQNNDLVSGLGALTISIGLIIPMSYSSNDPFYNIDFSRAAIYPKNDKITYEYLISSFNRRDLVTLITLSGNVYNAVIDEITEDKVYVYDGYGREVSINLNLINSIEHQSKN